MCLLRKSSPYSFTILLFQCVITKFTWRGIDGSLSFNEEGVHPKQFLILLTIAQVLVAVFHCLHLLSGLELWLWRADNASS
jgi:hypothetical protein